MTTLTNTYSHSNVNENNTGISGSYNRFIKKMEFSHYSVIAMSILIVSCLGAITTMQIFENDAPLWQFMVSVGFTMANLVGCIGQAPTKWVFNLSFLAILANTILLLVNIL